MIARASAIRWRWPPDSWRGLRFSRWRDLERFRDGRDPGRSVARGEPPDLQGVADVVLDRHVGIERVALEDHRHVALTGREIGHVAAADPDPSRGGRLQPGDDPERGRLAAAGRSEEDDELAVGHGQVDRLQDAHAVEPLLDSGQLDLGHRVSPRGPA